MFKTAHPFFPGEHPQQDKDSRRCGSGTPRSRAPSKRANGGVIATIERVTGISPCPGYLRTIPNQW